MKWEDLIGKHCINYTLGDKYIKETKEGNVANYGMDHENKFYSQGSFGLDSLNWLFLIFNDGRLSALCF